MLLFYKVENILLDSSCYDYKLFSNISFCNRYVYTINFQYNIIGVVTTMSKEYETIDIVKLRDLLETTRNIGRLLTEEEFNEIMMVFKKVIDRHWNDQEMITMSKEMERIKSAIHFYKCLIKELNYLNFITKTNNYDIRQKIMKIDYQNYIKEFKI